MSTPLPIETALCAGGDLLRTVGAEISIVVGGGATMNLLGIVRRSTNDVDVIARAFRGDEGMLRLSQAEPSLPARRPRSAPSPETSCLPANWMNAEAGARWVHGLAPCILKEITWRTCGNLHVGLVGRRISIAQTPFAAVDRGYAVCTCRTFTR